MHLNTIEKEWSVQELNSYGRVITNFGMKLLNEENLKVFTGIEVKIF